MAPVKGPLPVAALPNREASEILVSRAAPEREQKASTKVTIHEASPTAPSYPQSKINLVDRYIDEPRALRVAVIGGGLTGVLAGILLPSKVPNIQLTIIDKNKDFGGTWLENVYPGVRCDIPSHVYQATFAPKTDWSDQFALGAEIREYWQGLAREHDVYRFAKFGRRVEEAAWDEAEGVWRLTTRDVDTGAEVVETAEFIITATGRFNDWRLPEYPGIHNYEGVLRHASNWDPAFNPAGKRIAVIGNGASGIQLVANLQKTVARLDHYARSRTWIATSWAGDERTAGPQPYPPELVESLSSDPEAYLAFRKQLEDKYWRGFDGFLRGSDKNKDLRERFVDVIRSRLAAKPELADDFVPDFSPNCRRLTPGPGYLEALAADNVEYIRTPIRRFTARGIETADGQVREVDAVICATGSDGSLRPAFPIRARGRDLRDIWGDDASRGGRRFPYTYLGLATPGFPNLLFAGGPHGTGPAGTVPHAAEVQLAYAAKVLRKAAREGIRGMAPTGQAADEFVEWSDALFAGTVLTDGCSSWYNGGRPGGRIHGVWPGSAAHLTVVRREPRWEDFEYTYVGEGEWNGKGNRFAWYFGNGKTRKEEDPKADMTSYLRVPGEVDLRAYHEEWWNLP